MMQKSEFLRLIQANINAHGYHVTVVTGGALPRYAYTIGCVLIVGAELVFAGGEYYSQAQIREILDAFVSRLSREPIDAGFSVWLGLLGTFTLAPVDASWRNRVLLGAVDYHAQPDLLVWQIVPEGLHRTLDVPEMAQAFDATAQPVWQWLDRPWPFPVPAHSMVLTEVQVLRGAAATEMMRWEADDWEIFAGAGPEVPAADRRMVPLGVLLGIDPTLEPAVYLPIGKGLWRDIEALEWNEWG
ncbi:DUF4262 domain-containing protein [Hymenobacter terrestris]|uniref:DUF4262 domain-containing protein n=1 Tax=Hymenobacter terrestris TaxID=2748310 RepID=A0ABX2Q3W6_9BACT|nr:DUF4262 domain-containing protein [Hymenobacter terrestris]NVO84462.1 DUF4262 domain-containing protein [Hymenobacter terrestris]